MHDLVCKEELVKLKINYNNAELFANNMGVDEILHLAAKNKITKHSGKRSVGLAGIISFLHDGKGS